jgi:mycothiol synthase
VEYKSDRHMKTDYIELNRAPAIDGLKFQRCCGAEDLPKILAIVEDCVERDAIERVPTLVELAAQYDRLENCNPLEDLIFAEINGQAIGFTRVFWWEDLELGLRYVPVGLVVPQWRRRGIGTALLDWSEQRLRSISTTHPPASAKHFQVKAFEFQVDNIRLLERSGYTPVRYFEQLVRPDLDNIPTFALPAGLSMRAAVPEHYRAIWTVVEETFRDCWGGSEFTEATYQAWLADTSHFQPHLWQIAWDDATDEIVGHILTFIDVAENDRNQRQRGYTEVIGVRRAWRKQGVARALISRSLQAQKAAGMTESALGVDSDNPSGANKLYERCGFQFAKRQIVFNKPLDFLQKSGIRL